MLIRPRATLLWGLFVAHLFVAACVAPSQPATAPAAPSVSVGTPISAVELAPLPTPAPTPTPQIQYLSEEIPPCTPVPGSSVDPCELDPGWAPRTVAGGSSTVPPLRVEDLLNSVPSTPMFATHVVLRATYLPGTVRCTSGHRNRYSAYRTPGTLVNALLIYCFADMRLNAYLLGSGPPTLTVILHKSLYALPSDGDEEYGQEQLESRRLAYERALAEGGRFEYDEALVGYLPPDGGTGPLRLEDGPDGLAATGPPGGIGGREVVMFIRPSINTSVEAWEINDIWEVERRAGGTVVAIHPYREWFNLETYGSLVEMELPALTEAVTTAHQARVAANGGRIGADESLPMLVTDANRLRQYFSDPKVGAYAPGVPTPTQPPPPCGLAVPNQSINPGLMRDCITLLGLKDTLRGTAALNWSVDVPISDWDSVRMDGTPGRVTQLLLSSDGIDGEIPPELSMLDRLTYLALDGNELTGEIPSELGDLSGLEKLHLDGNRLTGCVPASLREVADNDLDGLGLEDC